ncbi:unnamed protein product [Rangifer tarandus platyrhynchus]|uniref:Uncharacterized protein n=1 Tax=Rangifer tarandus platyrhynchus TaxID=3082113 RepID=A0AC59YG65_RANTA
MVAERGHRRGPGLSLQSRDRAWDASESLTRAGQRRYANAGQREAPQVCAPGLRRSLSWMLANPKSTLVSRADFSPGGTLREAPGETPACRRRGIIPAGNSQGPRRSLLVRVVGLSALVSGNSGCISRFTVSLLPLPIL